MTFRTLLLGSATALGVVGGAQAADLHVAEPVDYLKACSNYGPGYYQTGAGCIKFGGYVRFDTEMVFSGLNTSNLGVNFNSGSAANIGNGGIAPTGTYQYGDGTAGTGNITTDNHRFRTRAQITATYKQATEYGPLTAYIAFLADNSGGQWGSYGSVNPTAVPVTRTNNDPDNSFGVGRGVALDEAYIDLAWFRIGMTGSTFDFTSPLPGSALTGSTTITGPYGRSSEGNTDLIRVTIPVGGFYVQAALEDYRDRGDRVQNNFNPPKGSFPDVVAAAGAKLGIVEGRVSFGYGLRRDFNVWGVQGGLSFDLGQVFTKGDVFSVLASYSHGDGEYLSDPNKSAAGRGNYWGIAATARHYFVPDKFYVAASGGYISTPDNPGLCGTGAGAPCNGLNPWNVALRGTWLPVTGLALSAEGVYYKNSTASSFFDTNGTWVVTLRAQKDLN